MLYSCNGMQESAQRYCQAFMETAGCVKTTLDLLERDDNATEVQFWCLSAILEVGGFS